MKKLLIIGAFLCSVFGVQSGYSYYANNYGSSGYSSGAYAQDGAPCEQACNECYCLYVRYEPCYSTTKRCVEEQIPCKKKCYRYVPCYHQVQRCRYVPQYYTETVCTQKCECYDECYNKTCKKIICEPCCTYKPRYYWKHVCGDQAPCCP